MRLLGTWTKRELRVTTYCNNNFGVMCMKYFLMLCLCLQMGCNGGGSSDSEKKSQNESVGTDEDSNWDLDNNDDGSQVYELGYEEKDKRTRCTTGLHEFRSKSLEELRSKFCNALRNEKLNNNCAKETRKGYFNSYCRSMSDFKKIFENTQPRDPNDSQDSQDSDDSQDESNKSEWQAEQN
jgi:hypothetical protein